MEDMLVAPHPYSSVAKQSLDVKFLFPEEVFTVYGLCSSLGYAA
jgi:hypothetical protein